MLSDQGADLVMSEIEYHAMTLMDLDNFPVDRAISNAVLNHLYDLHRMRNQEIRFYLERCWLHDNNTMQKLNEVHYA